MVGAGLICLGLVIVKSSAKPFKVRTYLHYSQGLQPGAPVSIDGVRAGSVATVKLSGGSLDHPIEVVMNLDAAQQWTIPNDSKAMLTSDGVLGPTSMEIDTRGASGVPIQINGVIKSLEVTDYQAAHALEVVGNALIDASKKLRNQNERPNAPAGTK
jgi:ABC-type transporter Mla subunit MlaD